MRHLSTCKFEFEPIWSIINMYYEFECFLSWHMILWFQCGISPIPIYMTLSPGTWLDQSSVGGWSCREPLGWSRGRGGPWRTPGCPRSCQSCRRSHGKASLFWFPPAGMGRSMSCIIKIDLFKSEGGRPTTVLVPEPIAQSVVVELFPYNARQGGTNLHKYG